MAKSVTVTPERIFVYALGVGAVGGAVYLAREYFLGLKAGQNTGADYPTPTPIIINQGGGTSKSSTTTSHNDNFPLKIGSWGNRVTLMQQGLSRVLGMNVVNKNGGIDGKFGTGTATMLKLAGYPSVIDETTYNRIVGNSSTGISNPITFNPTSLASNLKLNAESRNIEGVISILRQLNNVSDYTAVNEAYKKFGLISKTIVTDLLDGAFSGNAISKDRIKEEFMRMGLKLNQDSGTWSLQGIKLFRDIVTFKDTFVKDASNQMVLVKRNTILGDEVKTELGTTWFRAIDNTLYSVPTSDVKYV